ncbi:hypothetical protein SEA_KUWABARA_79 [Gordonia phage Kuwabara]|nr:hypothetical protein SEA_KUWABARA_79 [Gordonia phage Kuwabara]
MSDIGFGPVGDPPIIYDTSTTDGYGRVTRLVDRRLLEQAQARIVELAEGQELMQAQRDDIAHWNNVNYAKSCELLSELTEVRKVLQAEPERECDTAVAARRVVAERDHWRAEAEKARTRCSQLMHDIAETDDLTPDADNPAHLRFAAEVARQLCDSRRGGGWYATSCRFTAEADRLESEATADDVEYPETLAVAKMIYENLPSEDPGGGVEPWDELTDEQRAPFLMNARNLGHVFPEEYPKLAAELARYRAAATADDVVEKADPREVIEQAIRNHSSAPWLQLPGPVDLVPGIARAIDCALDVAGLLRGDR